MKSSSRVEWDGAGSTLALPHRSAHQQVDAIPSALGAPNEDEAVAMVEHFARQLAA